MPETSDDHVRLRRPLDSRYLVQSVDKALRLLEFVAESTPDGITLKSASEHLQVSKSAAFALLRTLEFRGFLQETASGHRYQLGLALLWLGDLVDQQQPLAEIARPALHALTEASGMTSRLAVADDGYPVFVDRVDGAGLVRFQTVLGRRELPHTSAAGKAILATLGESDVRRIAAESGLPKRTPRTITHVDELLRELQKVQRDGYAVDDEEDSVGVLCVGAAVYERGGRCVGAVSVTGIKQSVTDFEGLARTVVDYAAAISRSLGHDV